MNVIERCRDYYVVEDDINHIRIYNDIFDMKKSVDFITELNNKLGISEAADILVPKIEASTDGSVVSFIYPATESINKLFTTYYEKVTDDGKFRGDYYHILNYSQRISIALRVCNIFLLVMEKGINITNPCKEMLLYDVDTDKLLFDVAPYILPRNKQSEETFIRENVEFIQPLSNKAKRIFQTKANAQNDRTCIILSLMLYKILVGEDCLKFDTYQKIINKNNAKNIVSNKLFLPIIDEQFRCGLVALMSGKAIDNNVLLSNPNYWIEKINKELICACGGCFERSNNVKKICQLCKRNKIGSVRCVDTGVSVSLMVPSMDYFADNFRISNQKEFLFKVHQRIIAGKDETTLFFDNKADVKLINKGRCELIADKTIKTKNLLKYIIIEQKEFRIEIGKLLFEFTIECL